MGRPILLPDVFAYAYQLVDRTKDVAECLRLVAEFPQVSHANWIPLTSLDRHRHRLAADGDLDDLLHVGNLDAVARYPLAVDLDLQVRLADDAVGKHRRGLYGRDLL